MNDKLKQGLLIFILGMIGVSSLYFMELPEGSLPASLYEQFSDVEIRLLTMINPALLLLIATIAGTLTISGTPFRLPIINKVIGVSSSVSFKKPVMASITAGLATGVALVGIARGFEILIPEELKALGEGTDLSLFMRFAYGGITEEILMRFGLMTFLVWLIYKISDRWSIAIWAGLLLSAVVFALGHLPVVMLSVDSPSALLIVYIILGNSVGGLVFGWLYWKKGLEFAMIAHIFTHVAMVLIETI